MKVNFFLVLFILLVAGIQQNVSGQLFKENPIFKNKGLVKGKIINADFNNDDLIDILLTGEDSLHKQKVFFLINQKGVFDSIPSEFIITSGTSAHIMDFDHNGLVDVVLMGKDTLNKPASKLYLNRDNLIFELSAFDFEPLYQGAVNSFDFDNDGRKDLIFSGINENGKYKTNVYQNYADSIVQRKVNIVALSNGEILPIDFDKDGLIDLFINGTDSLKQKKSLLYKNHGEFNFSEDFEFEGMAFGDASSGDFNLDGKTDLLC